VIGVNEQSNLFLYHLVPPILCVVGLVLGVEVLGHSQAGRVSAVCRTLAQGHTENWKQKNDVPMMYQTPADNFIVFRTVNLTCGALSAPRCNQTCSTERRASTTQIGAGWVPAREAGVLGAVVTLDPDPLTVKGPSSSPWRGQTGSRCSKSGGSPRLALHIHYWCCSRCG
jgi:hypothetical protein